jgi:hypothetical protein
VHKDTDVSPLTAQKADHVPLAGAVVREVDVNEWEITNYDENGNQVGNPQTVYGREGAAVEMARIAAPDVTIERRSA